MADLGSIYGTKIAGSNTLVIDFSNVDICGNLDINTLNTTNNINIGIGGVLTVDRGNNNTSLVKFTSSTQTGTVGSTPTIIVGDIETTGRMGFDFKFREGGTNSSTYTLFRAYNGSTSGNGFFQVFGATYSANGWSTSDDRFKHGEYNIVNGLETIRKLVPQTYKKTIKMLDADNDGTNIGIENEDWHWESGLIAQEVEKIPVLSKYVKDLDNTKYVSYNDIHIHTIAATQELDTIVQTQQTEITELKNENTLLKNALNELLSEAGKPTI